MTEETMWMKLTWSGHSAFRIEAGAAKIPIRFCPLTRPGTRGGSAAVQARTRHGEAYDEGDRGDGPSCGNGRDEAGGTARAAGSDKRRRRSGSCVGIHLG